MFRRELTSVYADGESRPVSRVELRSVPPFWTQRLPSVAERVVGRTPGLVGTQEVSSVGSLSSRKGLNF